MAKKFGLSPLRSRHPAALGKAYERHRQAYWKSVAWSRSSPKTKALGTRLNKAMTAIHTWYAKHPVKVPTTSRKRK